MLKFRPHHFLCMLGFRGRGYSESFVNRMNTLQKDLKDGTLIEVTDSTDTICGACPNRKAPGVCESQEKVEALDEAHAAILHLVTGNQITWAEARDRLKKHMTPEAFEHACDGCEWKSAGFCRDALSILRSEKGSLRRELGGSMALIFGAGFLVSVLLGTLVFNPSSSCAQDLFGTFDEIPIDTLMSRMMQMPKQPKAALLRDSWNDLTAKRLTEARKKAAVLQSDAVFGDYAWWIGGQSLIAAAENAMKIGRADRTVDFARRASRHLVEIQAGYPYSPLLKPSARELARTDLLLGDAFYELKKWPDALDSYEKGFQRLSVLSRLGIVRPATMDRYGNACKNTDRKFCLPWLQRLASAFPASSPEMSHLLRFAPLSQLKPKLPVVNKGTQTYRAPDPDHEAFYSAMSLALNKKPADAIELLENFLRLYPRSSHRFRARFWIGKLNQDSGNLDVARDYYQQIQDVAPHGYYAVLSTIQLGLPIETLANGLLPRASSSDPNLTPLELFRVQRGEAFLLQKAHDLAEIELKDLKPREALSSPFLYYLAELQSQAGAHHAATLVITELLLRHERRAFSTFTMRRYFPLEHWDLIKKAATEFEVDPVLLMSLVKQESGFESEAVSSAGAQGLTQVMPSTAIDISSQVLKSDLTNEEINLRLGAKYLGQLLRRFKGNIILTLAGYNAGPNAANRWYLENGRRRSPIEFIETIPYRETKDYVTSILRNYWWYSKVLNLETKPIEHFWKPDDAAELRQELLLTR